MPVFAIKALAMLRAMLGTKEILILLAALFIGWKFYSLSYNRGADNERQACIEQKAEAAAEQKARLAKATARYRKEISDAQAAAQSAKLDIKRKIERADKRKDAANVCFSKKEIAEIWR